MTMSSEQFGGDFSFTWTPEDWRPLPEETLKTVVELVGEDQVAQVETLIAMCEGKNIKPMSPQKARPALEKMSNDLDAITSTLKGIMVHPDIVDWLFKGLEESDWPENHKEKMFETLSAFGFGALLYHFIRLKHLVEEARKVAQHGSTSAGSLMPFVVIELARLIYLHNGSLYAPRLKGGGRRRSLLRELATTINKAFPRTIENKTIIEMKTIDRFLHHAKKQAGGC